MTQAVRDLLLLLGLFGLALAIRVALPGLWPFDMFPSEHLFEPMDPVASLWTAAVLLPVWAASLFALGAWSEADPAPALPSWLLAGPVALMLSLAGFELLRLEPVPRSLVVGHAALATAALGLVHGPARAPDRSILAHGSKRAVDVLLGGLLLLLSAPLVGLFAARIRAHDGGPVLFVQERVGRDGRPFKLVKLRTMAVDAEARQAQLDRFNIVRGPAFRMADDPRVTGPGRWLRTTGLDELPQLINVLRGEMSLVGPRPPLPSEVARYTAIQRGRLSVLPGITGLWQLTGRELADFDAWVAVDLDYIARRSLWLDLTLLLRTLPWLAAKLARSART